MQPRSSHPMLRAHDERVGRAGSPCGEDPGRRCAVTAYTVFCREHWPVYSRFATAVTGSTPVGRDVARAVLEQVGAKWSAALRSASPSGYAWTLLTDALAPHRTEGIRALYEDLRAEEADALVLRHRLGCSAADGGQAMGLSSAGFELLRSTALRNAARPNAGRHMPGSDAV
ncbi:hypothetical protein [Streptomyces sp. NPDC002104]